jgi:glycosyltransferase involved in cell wall biosynthesis
MKIGIDIRLIGKKQTGSEAVFFNLVKNLVQIDSQNKYLLFTDITGKETLDKIGSDLGIIGKSNFRIISLPTANKFTWNFWTLQKYLRKNPVDIYLTQYITPFFVPKKIRIITIIHDISFKVYRQFIKKSDLFFLNLLIPWSLKRADKIVAVSQFTRDEIIKYYKISEDKVDWIHNAVSEDFRQLADETKNISPEKLKQVKEKYNLPEKFILYIGTLQPRKNIPTLIEAYGKLIGRLSSTLPFDETSAVPLRAGEDNMIKLVIAGGKSHNFDPKIDETVKKYDLEENVVFPGFIDEEDKAAIIKMARVFCFPSFYEGFGIPILEAFAVGTPVAASDIAPHREITEGAALLFDPQDPEDLERKLISILSDDAVENDFVQKGLNQLKKFSWKNTAEKMLEIFEGME